MEWSIAQQVAVEDELVWLWRCALAELWFLIQHIFLVLTWPAFLVLA